MEYLTQKEYIRITKSLLIKNYKNQINTILNDNDYFYYLVSEVMWADAKFNGTGTLYGYRKQRLKWAMSRIKQQIMKRKPVFLSELQIKKDGREYVCMELASRDNTRDVENRELLDKFISRVRNGVTLTDNEKYILEQYFIYQTKVLDLCEKLNLKKGSIYRSIKRGLIKLGIRDGNFR